MTTDLMQIRARALDFRTDQTTDWLDGLPLIAVPAFAGALAGAANAGVGAVTVSAVDPSADEGVILVGVSAVASGVTQLAATGLDGSVVGTGVVGLPMQAGGVTLTLAQVAGQAALAVGDTFAVALTSSPLDISGFTFALKSTLDAKSASVVFSAVSTALAGTPAIMNGGAAGTLAMEVPKAFMAQALPGDYPYVITATDTSNRTVPVFIGTIRHRALPTLRD